MFLKNKNITFKIRRSKVTDYAALTFIGRFLQKNNNFVKIHQELHRKTLLLNLLTPILNKTFFDNFK